MAIGNFSSRNPSFLGVSLMTEKIITLVAMTGITFLFGMLPIKPISKVKHNQNDQSRTRWRTIISFCSCFSGGVFIAACLLDMLPELQEKVDEIREGIKDAYNFDIEYPLSQFVMCCGFFLILTLEQAVLHFQENWIQESEERQHLLSQTPYQQQPVSNDVRHSSDGHGHLSNSMFQHSTLRSFMLLVALSFHSIFEGIAIGLQEEEGSLLSIFMAVMSHKAVMAFSLGLNIAQSNLSLRNFILSNVVFSLSSPIGIGIGIGMCGMPPSLSHDICSGILQGIAGGTFMYITFFEVLPHELNVPKNRLWKIFFVMLGFVSLCGLLFICH